MIQGQLPPSQPPDSVEELALPGRAGRWFRPEEARAATRVRVCVCVCVCVRERERERDVRDGRIGAGGQGRGLLGCHVSEAARLSRRSAGLAGQPAHPVPEPMPRLLRLEHTHPRFNAHPWPQEREQLKERGYAQAAAQGVLGKAAGGQGSWLTLRRPGAKRALDEEEAADGAAHAEVRRRSWRALSCPQPPGSTGHLLPASLPAFTASNRARVARAPHCPCQQGDDPSLARALAASLAHGDGSRPHSRSYGGAAGSAAAADEDADLAAAIAASLADHQGPPPQQEQQQQQAASPRSVAAGGLQDDEDAELAAAIAASMQPAGEQQGKQQQQQQEEAAAAPASMQLPALQAEPEAGAEGCVEVALRLPGGRVSRRFHGGSDTVGHLAAFAAASGADMAACQLALQFPRRLLGDWEQTLAAAGVEDKQLVAVEPKK